MNKQALFCDGTARYVCPLEPEVGETVTLKFRAAKEDNIQIRLAINNELYTMEVNAPMVRSLITGQNGN